MGQTAHPGAPHGSPCTHAFPYTSRKFTARRRAAVEISLPDPAALRRTHHACVGTRVRHLQDIGYDIGRVDRVSHRRRKAIASDSRELIKDEGRTRPTYASPSDAYDKTARLLNITTNWTKESPGASLEAFAAEHTASAANIAQTLPAIPGYKRPFVDKPFFSYSGIKSAIRRHIEQLASTDHARSARREGEKVKSPKVGEASSVPIEERQKWAAAFQKAALDQIEDKLKLVLAASTPPRPSSASDDQSKIAQQWRNGIATEEQMALLLQDIRRSQHLVVSGGVASNQELRRRLAEFWRVEEGRHLLFPPIQLCVDVSLVLSRGFLFYFFPPIFFNFFQFFFNFFLF